MTKGLTSHLSKLASSTLKKQTGKDILVQEGESDDYNTGMTNQTVMVVEDDKEIRNTLTLALELEGYEVLKAENGQKALDTLLSLPDNKLPGCIVLDLLMPVMDGSALLHVIYEKHNQRLGKIPVVLTSANGEMLDMNLVNVVAANIRKPFTLNQIYQIVGQFCSAERSL